MQIYKITGEKNYKAGFTPGVLSFRRDFGDFIFSYSSHSGQIQFVSVSPDEYELTATLIAGENPANLWRGETIYGGNEFRPYYLYIIEKAIKEIQRECYAGSREACQEKLDTWLKKHRNVKLRDNNFKEFELKPKKVGGQEWIPGWYNWVCNRMQCFNLSRKGLSKSVNVEQLCFIPLNMSDKIKSIDKQGNIITILFENPADSIKYTLYSHAVFDGHLTRPRGYFSFKNDEPDSNFLKANYVLTEPLNVEHLNINDAREKLGFCEIPAGSYVSEVDSWEAVKLNDPTSVFFVDGYTEGRNHGWGMVCDSSGKKTHSLEWKDGWTGIYWKDGQKIAEQRRIAEETQYNQKKNAILTSYKTKYGATTINNIMKGVITVGMPWSLLQQIFPNGVLEQGQSYTTYKVINNIPRINVSSGKIEKEEYGLGNLRYVTVRNGKVTNVFNTRHR